LRAKRIVEHPDVTAPPSACLTGTYGINGH
jgi:hypothetical protein